MQQTIPVNDRIIASHVGGTPSSGPFAVDFPYFSPDDVIVELQADGTGAWTALVRGADYTLTGVATEDGSFSSGSISLVLPISNTTIRRYGRTTIERLSNFPLQGFFSRLALNAELNRITVVLQEHDGVLSDTGGFVRKAGDTMTGTLRLPILDVMGAPASNAFIAMTDATGTPDLRAWAWSVNDDGKSHFYPVGDDYVGNGPPIQFSRDGTVEVTAPPTTDSSARVVTSAWVKNAFNLRGTGAAVYAYKGATLGTPASGGIIIDPGTGIARQIAMSATDADGLSRVLTMLLPGDTLTVTNELAPITSYARYDLIGAPIDHTTWVELPCHLIDSVGTIESSAINTRLKVTGFLNVATGSDPAGRVVKEVTLSAPSATIELFSLGMTSYQVFFTVGVSANCQIFLNFANGSTPIVTNDHYNFSLFGLGTAAGFTSTGPGTSFVLTTSQASTSVLTGTLDCPHIQGSRLTGHYQGVVPASGPIVFVPAFQGNAPSADGFLLTAGTPAQFTAGSNVRVVGWP